jgi:hypothetical protein
MTVQRYELYLISESVSLDINDINVAISNLPLDPFPYTGSALISGSLTVTGSIFSNETAFVTASNAVSASYAETASFVESASFSNISVSASYAETASFVENAGNVFSFKIENVSIASIEWEATGSIFKTDYMSGDIEIPQTIQFLPTADSMETIVNVGFSPFNVVNNGSVTFFTKTLPTGSINGDLLVTTFPQIIPTP